MTNTTIEDASWRNARSDAFRRRVSYYISLTLSVSTLLLLGAGALVTSTGSSLSVPDWPLAYGQWFPPMVGGIFYEHGHRMVATTVGFVTTVLALWLWRNEPRSKVRLLGWLLLFLVIFQGVLGGITVLYLLPKSISISHAMMAQIFFLLSVVVTQMTAPGYEQLRRKGHQAARQQPDSRLPLYSALTLGLLLTTLLLGAATRHFNAGMAIPDFPLNYGQIIPPLVGFPVILHFSHRVLAWLSLLAVITVFTTAMRRHREDKELLIPALLMLVLVVVQILLGGGVIWTIKSVFFTTVHLMNGALLIVTTGLLALRGRYFAGASALAYQES
ncbi:MAG: COX15/CtaA family protein [Deltaproteobacteria bacterium]|nr:COX15/CtaA family protein [Deltaproteobacteria bacterium]